MSPPFRTIQATGVNFFRMEPFPDLSSIIIVPNLVMIGPAIWAFKRGTDRQTHTHTKRDVEIGRAQQGENGKVQWSVD